MHPLVALEKFHLAPLVSISILAYHIYFMLIVCLSIDIIVACGYICLRGWIVVKFWESSYFDKMF